VVANTVEAVSRIEKINRSFFIFHPLIKLDRIFELTIIPFETTKAEAPPFQGSSADSSEPRNFPSSPYDEFGFVVKLVGISTNRLHD
jgi:hypothetical protein